MNLSQSQLNDYFSEFRIARQDAPYPPYHTGQYLEEYFVDKWIKWNTPSPSRLLIPVYWTAVFNHKVSDGLHEGSENNLLRKRLFQKLESLDPNKSYFTVSTHDDAPQGIFPKDTMHFYAGGNAEVENCHPIPLIASGFKVVEDLQKMVFCSFVGSTTNPIRNHCLSTLHDKPGYVIKAFHWQPNVTEDQTALFYNLTSQSRFTLCPRGYGATSYRLYEAMQLGSIPVYVSDKHLLPWSDELNWEEFCVIIKPQDIHRIDSILKSYTETQVREMQQKIKEVYFPFFTIPATYQNIYKRVSL